MKPVNVLLVDDHPVVRSGIRTLLEKSPDITVVGETSSGMEALRLANDLTPDVVVLDMELPDISGSEVAQHLQNKQTGVRILVLSAHDDQHYIQGLLSSGVSGYLMKDEAPEMIIEAVQGVARGENGWISRQVASKMTTWMQSKTRENNGLTKREDEVLHAIVAGKTNQVISLELGVSEKTVEKHIIGIFKKLGVTSRVEAAVLAVRRGWIR